MTIPARVLVSGAGSGIGRAVCSLALSTGSSVAALDKSTEGLAAVRGEGAFAITTDVADETSVVTAVADAIALLGGPPDAVICAAGIYRFEPALGLSAERFREMLAVNTIGSFLVARESVRAMSDAGTSGAVVLLASVATEGGDTAEPAAHYSASKGAIVALTRQLAVEWAELGIRVNAVSPGVIQTPMLRITDDPAVAETYLRSRVPLHRLGQADEVARACLWLAGPGSSYTTGSVLAVDGGASVG